MARMQSGLHTASSLAKTSFFTAMFSNTASITASTALISRYSVVPLMSPRNPSTCCALKRPRCTEVA